MEHPMPEKPGKNDLPDPQQIGELLDVVTEKLPRLLEVISECSESGQKCSISINELHTHIDNR